MLNRIKDTFCGGECDEKNCVDFGGVIGVVIGTVCRRRTAGGMIIGIFTMGLINYGMSFMAIDSYYQYLVKGAIIIVVVFFDMKKYAKRA